MSGSILCITRNLPPLTGGMERLCQQLLAALADDHDVAVIGPPGCAPWVDPRVTTYVCRSHAAGPFLVEAALRLLWLVLTGKRPHLLIASSGLTAPLAWFAARLWRCPYITCVHGLDLVVAHRLYQALFLPAIRASDRVVANSINTAKLARAQGVTEAQLRVVLPGIHWPETLPPATAAFGDRHDIRSEFRDRHGLGHRPVLLAVGRLTARKGLPEFVAHALPLVVRAVPDVLFVVIGEEARDAIRREHSVRTRLMAAITAAGMTEHVLLRGHADDAEVVATSVAAQVFVFPLLAVAGDVEGFGMVAAEAAACGLGTVAFDEGGVADAIVAGVTGRLVTPGDYAGLAAAILDELALAGDASRRASCRAAARRYAWPRYAAELTAVVDTLLDERGGLEPRLTGDYKERGQARMIIPDSHDKRTDE